MRIPNLTGSLVASAKFTYRQMVLLVLLSVTFWIVSVLVVTVGGAMIALFETVRRVPEENRSELSFLKTYVREVRRNFRTGLPLSVIAVGVPLATFMHLNIGITQQSGYYLPAGLLGIYITLVTLLLTLRTANVLSTDDTTSLKTAFTRAFDVSSDHPHFSVLHACVFVGLFVFSIVIPAFILFLFPGFVVVLEILLYEEATDSAESPIRRYLDTV